MLQPVLGEATSLAVFHSGLLSMSKRRIDFTFLKRQSTVNGLQQKSHTDTWNLIQRLVSRRCSVEDYIFLRAFSLSILRKKDKRSGGCHCLHSVPLQPWHGAASWERLSDPLQRRAGRFTGRRAERSANNKDGQRAVIARRCLFQVLSALCCLGV